MSGIQSEAFYTLFNPCVVAAHGDSPKLHTYLAVTKVEAGNFAVSIALPVYDEKTQLLPPGSIAFVMGTMVVVDKAMFITASAIVGVYLATSRALRPEYPKLFRPFLSFHGAVLVKVVDVSRPGVRAADITIDCSDRWPGMPMVVRCYFDRDEKRFRSLLAFESSIALELSGVLMGWVEGKLAVDIHQVDCDNGGGLPGEQLASYPNPYEKREVSQGFAVFNEPNTLPKHPGLPPLSRCPPGIPAKV